MAVLGYLPKFKRSLGLGYGARFLHVFLTLYQLTKFQCNTFFPSQDIKRNVLIGS